MLQTAAPQEETIGQGSICASECWEIRKAIKIKSYDIFNEVKINIVRTKKERNIKLTCLIRVKIRNNLIKLWVPFVDFLLNLHISVE